MKLIAAAIFVVALIGCDDVIVASNYYQITINTPHDTIYAYASMEPRIKTTSTEIELEYVNHRNTRVVRVYPPSSTVTVKKPEKK
jgi:hypothetical protein